MCQKEFSVRPYRINKAKFCSRECFGLSIKGVHPIREFKKGQHASFNTEFKSGNRHSYFGKSSPALGKHWQCSTENSFKKSKYWKNRPHPWQIGKLHWNWKGGITPENRKIRNSIEWKIWREKVFSFDNWKCWVCEIKGYLHPHHVKLSSKYPKLRFKVSNGITLCEFCHYTYGNHQK
mgnify:CR=1 FL=1